MTGMFRYELNFFMSCHCIIIPFITFSRVLCLWCPSQTGRGLVNSRLDFIPFVFLDILYYCRYVS